MAEFEDYNSIWEGEEIDDAIAKLRNTGGSGTAAITAAQVGAAPDGFGLGGSTGAIVTNADDANKNGWYRIPAPSGFGSGNLWCFVSALSGTYITQTLYTDYGIGSVAIRFKLNGVWKPWEWVNPPMNTGVEYRTTERYLEKPVYIKAVDFGALPNETTKQVAYTTESVQHVSHGGYFTDGTNAYSIEDYGSDSGVRCYISAKNISVVTKRDYTSYTGYVWVKYYKTTD